MTEAPIEVVVLDEERRVAVHRLAEGNTGRVPVLCHPAPGAGAFDADPDETPSRGVTLLGAERPGYGRSDPMPDGEGANIGAAVQLSKSEWRGILGPKEGDDER